MASKWEEECFSPVFVKFYKKNNHIKSHFAFYFSTYSVDERSLLNTYRAEFQLVEGKSHEIFSHKGAKEE